MSLVSTLMLLGTPTSTGTSKADRVLMKTKTAAAARAGQARRRDTRQKVSSTEAPLMRAASSISALAERKAAENIRKTSGIQTTASITTMPQSELTLNRM